MTAPGRFREARDLFADLVELSSAERETRLAALEARDPGLGAEVRRLLEADAKAGAFLEEPAQERLAALAEEGAGEADDEPEIPVGERIGPYRTLRLLGRGGMGEVFLAERADGQFEQQVALKLVKRGMDSEEILLRFRRERQILARLSHPNIARLFDGGLAEDGRPYFALECVDGETITAFSASRDLSIEERVRLAVVCCDAVDAAHRSLVVHRDLKPSNILVTKGGEVKLLDFGIAKLLEADGADASDATVTRRDSRALTPAYAAPELILGEPATTAADVYSLGVVLYELLTGTLPFERKGATAERLAARVDDEILERPSQRVRRVVADRRIAARLARRLAGDLDNILLTALRREPERRYRSAAALAEDLRRHLAGLPVRARKDTFGYRAGKFLRRHRAGVAAAALVFVALVAGLAGTTWQARRAQAHEREASAQALRAARVKEFLITLFEVADPEKSGGRTVTARELLDQGTRRLKTELSAEPDVQADLLEAVARIDKSLGLLEPAASLAEESLRLRRGRLPGNDPAVGSSLATLGAVQLGQGKLEEAERHLANALAILEAREGPLSLNVARARSDYSEVLFYKGKVVESEKLERKVYETYRQVFGSEHVQTAIHQRNLCVLLDELDRLEEAEVACRDSQGVLERHLGAEHANLGQSYLNTAELLYRRGKMAEAETLYRRALDVRKKTLGEKHPATGQNTQLLALFLLNQGRLDEAEAAYREALALFTAIDPKHFEVAKCRNGLGLIESRRGHYAASEAILRDVVASLRSSLGDSHHFVWLATGNVAEQVALQGRLAEAEKMQREVVAKLEETRGKEMEEVGTALSRLSETLRRRGAFVEAATCARRSLAIQTKIAGPEQLAVALASYQLGAALAALPEPESRREAAELLDRAAALFRKLKPDHPRLPDVLRTRQTLAAL
jgi:eukaryotic-like serine/threonine-protein kinase